MSLYFCLLLLSCSVWCVFATDDFHLRLDRSSAKMSSSVTRELPSPSFEPLIYMIVDIYLAETDISASEDLPRYLQEVFYEEDGIVEALVRADNLPKISSIPSVEYIDFPRAITLTADAEKDVFLKRIDLAEKEASSKMSTNLQKEMPSPAFSSLFYLVVDIYLKENHISKAGQLEPYATEITYNENGIIEAKVRADRLSHIVQTPFVSYVDFPLLQNREKEIDLGGTVSEAVNCTTDLMGIRPFRDENFTGKGVTVALLDGQFYYDGETVKELPEDFVLISNSSYTKHEVHGTACAELIADVAPDVKLYLVDVGRTEFDFINSIENLMKVEPHIGVVSCSVDFHFGPFGGGDNLCKQVQNMTSKGTAWVNAAGNEAQCHWEGTFVDPDRNDLNNFSQDDESINITLEKGDPVTLWLSWGDDWLRASQDYDLRLDYPHGDYSVSDNPQKGYRGHKPIETISLFAPENGVYQIKIKKYDPAAKDVKFNLFTTHDLDEYRVPNSSIGVLASCEDVITVGAIDVSTLEIEPYSSRGPTEDGRLKPDVVAPDNVTTSSYYSRKFNGTSASAPYVAGCLALAMQMFDGENRSDVKNLLTENAVDLGPSGPDNTYGYGLINLKNLMEVWQRK